MSKNTELVFPVFRLKPESETSGQIKYVGNIKEKEELIDELLELDLDKNDSIFDKKLYNSEIQNSNNTLFLGKILDYDITATIHKCNLSGSFLIVNNELPIYYISFKYSKPIVSGNIFDYYLTFNIDNESKKKLIKPSQYTNAIITGNYNYGININEKIYNNYKDLLKKEYSNDEQILSNIDKYEYFFKKIKIENTNLTLTNIKKYFNMLLTDEKLIHIINIAIKSREEERLINAGIDLNKEYKIPDEDKSIKLNDINNIKDKFNDLLSL